MFYAVQQQYSAMRHLSDELDFWWSKYVKVLEDEQAAAATLSQDELSPQQRVDEAFLANPYMLRGWSDNVWGKYSHSTLSKSTDKLRVGEIERSFPHLGLLHIPILVPLLNTGHILVISQGAKKTLARKILSSLVLRAILTLSYQPMKCTFFDPLGLGSNFPFSSLPKSMRGESVYTEQDEIQEQLKELTNVIRSDDSQYILRLLCVADFPTRFDEDSMKRLLTIAEQGRRKNIYTIVHVDSDIALPEGFDPMPLMSVSTIIYATSDSIRTKVDNEDYVFRPDDLPDTTVVDTLLSKVKVNHE